MRTLSLSVYLVFSPWISLTVSQLELAQNKVTSYSMPYPHRSYWHSGRAVDGDTNTNVYCGSCAHTAVRLGTYYSWWQVNLSGIFAISRVLLYNGEPYSPSEKCENAVKKNYPKHTPYSERLKGYRLVISNSSDYKNGYVCHTEQSFRGEYPDLFQNVSCVGVGSHLTLYNDHVADVSPYNRSVIVMCEVKVYGCPVGTYGVNCATACPETCMSPHCVPETGNCFECKDGWYGEQCDKECSRGYYGPKCSKNCPPNCLNQKCHHTTGLCSKGCQEGWMQNKCDKQCLPGNYGQDCRETCGQCKTQLCLYTNGSCPKGCQIGYEGETCKQECPLGRYGENCSSLCGNCFQQRPCNHRTGICEMGCADGFYGLMCTEKCPLGSYGENCSSMCGYCFQQRPCHHRTGICEMGCTDGFYGVMCTEKKITNMTIIAIGSSSGSVILVIISITVVCLRRKNRSQTTQKSMDKTTPVKQYELPVCQEKSQQYEIGIEQTSDDNYDDGQSSNIYEVISDTEK